MLIQYKTPKNNLKGLKMKPKMKFVKLELDDLLFFKKDNKNSLNLCFEYNDIKDDGKFITEETSELKFLTGQTDVQNIISKYFQKRDAEFHLNNSFSKDFAEEYNTTNKILFSFDDLMNEIMIQMHIYLMNRSEKYSFLQILSMMNGISFFLLKDETLEFICNYISLAIDNSNEEVIEYEDSIFDDKFYDKLFNDYQINE